MTVLFLYTELADYFLKCCDQLSRSSDVHIVRWPVNKEAPFKFQSSARVKIYDKNSYSRAELQDLVVQIKPDILVCSGWVDKDYLAVAKPYFKKIPTVLTCDTRWAGTLKQYLATFLSRIFLLNTFSHAWVPGESTYPEKLGFKPDKIKKGFYCCDLDKFNAIFQKQFPAKTTNFPKRFLFVGRYYDFKGIRDLWDAFIQLQQEAPNDWELWCLGTGSIEPVTHPKIKHFGFVQPGDLEPLLNQTGVFVLPSRFEPWGVVVQEYASAGFPLLLSHRVGAKQAFLKEGINGFSFEAGNASQLKTQLKKITELTGKELILMAEQSHIEAQKITPANWSATLLDIYNEFSKK